MTVLGRLAKSRIYQEETYTSPRTPWFGTRSKTGITVGRDRGMQLSTVWSCIRARAETIGALPVEVVEHEGKVRRPVDAPAWLEKPNSETTRFELFERTAASIDADGNAFWGLERDRLQRVVEVWPLDPSSVHVFRDPPPRERPKERQPKKFRIGNEEFTDRDILHISGFRLPGRLRGLNPIEWHAHTLGLAIAAEEFGEEFFGNGAVMSGVIVAEGDPGETNAKRMQASFERDHRGMRNHHKPGFLFGGAKWEQLTIPNDSAQFLETRKYQRDEIIGIYRVPPHKVGVLDRATFSNIEHQAIEWVTDGLMPTTGRIEAAVHSAGMLDLGQKLRFKFAGLLRGDVVARYASYAIGRQWGWLCVDDIRELEDENPLPDGKGQIYLEPLNMRPAGETPDVELVDQVTAAGALVRAGYDPHAALVTVGLDPIRHLGLLPVTVQPPED